MKYFLLIADGMADEPLPELSGSTPLAAAETKNMDALARSGRLGLVRTIPPGCPAGSDVGILTLLGYDPCRYLTSRSALEAAGCGISLKPGQAACRCNLVTVSGGVLLSHSAGCLDEASTAGILAELLQDGDFSAQATRLGVSFYPASGFRLLCVGPAELLAGWNAAPPHEVLLQPAHLPQSGLLACASQVLARSRVNAARHTDGLLPATHLWPWAPGQAMALPAFPQKYGKQTAMISATPLALGIARLAGIHPIRPAGTTGTLHTDFAAKARAAIGCFRGGFDLVCVHVEAPDECSHNRDLPGKLRSIRSIDQKVLAPVLEFLRQSGEDFRILLLPDHPTLTATGVHSSAPVPWLLYDSRAENGSGLPFSEDTGAQTGLFLGEGTRLIGQFLGL